MDSSPPRNWLKTLGVFCLWWMVTGLVLFFAGGVVAGMIGEHAHPGDHVPSQATTDQVMGVLTGPLVVVSIGLSTWLARRRRPGQPPVARPVTVAAEPSPVVPGVLVHEVRGFSLFSRRAGADLPPIPVPGAAIPRAASAKPGVATPSPTRTWLLAPAVWVYTFLQFLILGGGIQGAVARLFLPEVQATAVFEFAYYHYMVGLAAFCSLLYLWRFASDPKTFRAPLGLLWIIVIQTAVLGLVLTCLPFVLVGSAIDVLKLVLPHDGPQFDAFYLRSENWVSARTAAVVAFVLVNLRLYRKLFVRSPKAAPKAARI